ncbi:hypothetical protein JOF56_009934 [Kibdelosporangium banguiense]|uniref:Uncharacterized protein n=1 Tax=Kibdelosporangium banguiense TaxID=1365924 RepID=A0ABS4TYS1_9PSEU|nr:hypothetical protein [Kibdelosporangium banguiense]MBP2329549.1 hypothetical protein [Kibdelosporangium banguiense]
MVVFVEDAAAQPLVSADVETGDLGLIADLSSATIMIVADDTPLQLVLAQLIGRALRKIYLNPQVTGPTHAGRLVAEGLSRLGINRAYDAVVASALTRGELDRLSFFALDLDDRPQSRVKLYISHEACTARKVIAARQTTCRSSLTTLPTTRYAAAQCQRDRAGADPPVIGQGSQPAPHPALRGLIKETQQLLRLTCSDNLSSGTGSGEGANRTGNITC